MEAHATLTVLQRRRSMQACLKEQFKGILLKVCKYLSAARGSLQIDQQILTKG